MEELFLVVRGTPAAVDDELDPVIRGVGCGSAQGTEQSRVKLGHARNLVVEDRRAAGDGTVGLAKGTAVLVETVLRGRRSVMASVEDEDEDASDW